MPSQDIDNNTLLTLSHVTFNYDYTRVLHDVNLVVQENDFIVITGPNGGGKTTLLRLLLRLLKPTQGSVNYYDRGTPCSHLSIGYLPQKNSIDSRFPISVREVIASGLYAERSLSSTECKERIDDTLNRLSLMPLAQHAIGELSGGQLQRVMLGRAIISRPRLLVLDEPLSYIDEAFIPHIQDLLQQMKQHTAIVMVTHQPDLVLHLATQHHTVVGGQLL